MNKTEALNRLTALEQEAKALREIIEAPEPAGSLLPVAGQYYLHSMHNGFMHDQCTAKAYASAIDTLIELRRQPGTEKPKDDVIQWTLEVGNDKIFVEYWSSTTNKISGISPCFASEEQAQAAIEKIGADRLKQMFNTLHGEAK